MTATYTLQEYETNLLHLINQQNKNWFEFGKKLAQVQSGNLHTQQNYKSFTSWLKAFSKQCDIGTTKLWKCLKVYKLITKIEICINEVPIDSVNGLARIAQIHETTNDIEQTKLLISDFVNKKTKVKELDVISKSLSSKNRAYSDSKDQIPSVENEVPILLPFQKSIHLKQQKKSKKYLILFIGFVALVIFALTPIQNNFFQ